MFFLGRECKKGYRKQRTLYTLLYFKTKHKHSSKHSIGKMYFGGGFSGGGGSGVVAYTVSVQLRYIVSISVR